MTTGLLTLLAVRPKRGVEAMADIGFLDAYSGVIVHDGLTAYDIFTLAAHAQCGAHLLLHLDDVGQTVAFELWTRQLAGVLCAARDASAQAAADGHSAVPEPAATAIRADYRSTLNVAFALLPAGTPPRRRHTGSWNHAKRKAFNLATRLRAGEPQVLRLLDNTAVPFTNNDAERALRMVKLHDKISGCFRTPDAASHFTAVRSYLQTAPPTTSTASTPSGNYSPPAPGYHHPNRRPEELPASRLVLTSREALFWLLIYVPAYRAQARSQPVVIRRSAVGELPLVLATSADLRREA